MTHLELILKSHIQTTTVLKRENEPISSSALASVGYCTYLKTIAFPNSNLTDEDASVHVTAKRLVPYD
jgi:hypothetical protein